MPTWAGPVIILALVIIAVVIALIALQVARRRRQSQELHETFGPEYDRTVSQYGSQGRAEAELTTRKERVEALDIRPLAPADRSRFTQAWRATQARFVDDPTRATTDADRLITDLLRVRGYPVSDFERRAADISVTHPNVVANYRIAHATSLANEQGQASTEDLRTAMIHYRALYDELLETDTERTTERTEVG
ncbi:MAG TPA: hypothetical protein VFQ25_10165 [Ktedonobacterales bacterium]|nr:hypothetical protein [Ktedonobacterales bacterium]